MYTPFKDGFYPELEREQQSNRFAVVNSATSREVEAALAREYLRPEDLLALLSPAALPHLEAMAQRAHQETIGCFGKSVQLFTPLYLSNYCTNRCVYCGFSAKRGIARAMLNLEEVEAEAKSIAATGLRKILALTGDDPERTGPAYLAACLGVLSRFFSSIGVEVPSMTGAEYALLVEAGADSMTMFQETYNEKRYARLHPAGPKRDFGFRLDAPQRALTGGMRAVNLGPLLGLDDWRRDLYFTALHARFLINRWPEAEISVSLPRMRTHTEGGEIKFDPLEVNDTHFVQALTALRCFLPQAGITMSSREGAWLRDKLVPLGVTRVSAGVRTSVGGHAESRKAGCAMPESQPQFDIADERSVEEMSAALRRIGYQPVFADWLLPGRGGSAISGGLRLKRRTALEQGLERYFTPDQLDKLARARVGIAGAGGLGSNCAMLLVRSGIKHLVIVDFDVVEPSNLNRQFYFPDDLGNSKVEALGAHLARINPHLELTAINCCLDPDSAAKLFGDCHVVVEALDRAEYKSMLCNRILATTSFVVSASGLGGYGGRPMEKRKIGERMICVGDFVTVTDALSPPLAPRVMQAAAMQADAVLEHVLGK